jgi:Mrp family chromosome partitioning ATPase
LEGIGEFWRQKEKPITEFLRRVGETSLYLLPAGMVAHPVAVLQSGRMADLLKQVAGWFDWVVVDTPPILPMADANLWARLSDGTLLVIREGVVQRRALQTAVDSMDSPKLIGVVLNDAADFDRIEYYGRYYLSENSADGGSKGKRKSKK